MLTRIYGTAFFTQGGARGAPASGSRRRARATTASSAASSSLFMFSELSPGLAVLAAERAWSIWNELTELWREENAARGYREVKTPILYDVELWKQSGPLGRVPRQHVLHGRRGPADGPQAHELPGARADLQATSAAPTATCRSATPSRASCTATSRAARCTACCASATSPRTTPTSSAPRSRSRTRSSAASTSASRSTTCSASSRGWSSRPGPEKRIGTEEMWDRAEAALAAARSTTAGSSTSSTRATAPSTARRSTCT